MYQSNQLSKRLSILILSLIFLMGTAALSVAQPASSNNDLARSIDEIINQVYKPGEPGAAVIVVKDGKVVHRKGYGMANLELGVPVEPDMIFRIGSITKQFTAVAILMLAEQGKLSLEDDLTKFLPDYPTKGTKITVEHLLTHTSGIKSYTSIPEWLSLWRKDMDLKELVGVFKDKPMDFAPGERYAYNNSAYVLLGVIIEKVSGQSYQDFVEKNIFAPLGMKHSFYDNTSRVIPRRVNGYSKVKDSFTNAAYLSMSQPYAAGSLVSSVDDLALWDAALYTDKLIKQESLKRAWTSAKLSSGKLTNYGFGWGISSYQGHRLIEHSGGINGFATYALRSADDRLYVAILTNRDWQSPGWTAFKVAAAAMGKPYVEPVSIKLSPASLDQYTGVYQIDEKEEVTIQKEGDKLIATLPGGGKAEILPSSETEFFIKDSRTRLIFTRSASGVTSFVLRDRTETNREARKTDKSLAAAPKEVNVEPAVFDGYIGAYELTPNLTITITKEDGKLMAQGTGQPKLQLFAESQIKFFVKEAPIQIEFVVDASGKATSLIVYQGGQRLPAPRIK